MGSYRVSICEISRDTHQHLEARKVPSIHSQQQSLRLWLQGYVMLGTWETHVKCDLLPPGYTKCWSDMPEKQKSWKAEKQKLDHCFGTRPKKWFPNFSTTPPLIHPPWPSFVSSVAWVVVKAPRLSRQLGRPKMPQVGRWNWEKLEVRVPNIYGT